MRHLVAGPANYKARIKAFNTVKEDVEAEESEDQNKANDNENQRRD